MLPLIFASVILTSSPTAPTEIIGSAATPDGGRNEIIVEQPQNSPNPFGYVAPPQDFTTPEITTSAPPETTSQPTDTSAPQTHEPVPLVSQSSAVYPQDMNPLDYKNQIENTIYQDGNRLIDVQSIPLQDISSAVQPNLQPTITDYPSL